MSLVFEVRYLGNAVKPADRLTSRGLEVDPVMPVPLPRLGHELTHPVVFGASSRGLVGRTVECNPYVGA